MTTQHTLYVSRPVPRPVEDLVVALEQAPSHFQNDAGVSLTLRDTVRAERVTWPGGPRSSVPGVLRAAPWRRGFGVSLEAAPRSTSDSEVAIRPESSACVRRSSRFCDAAHTILDHVGPTLLDLATRADPIAAPRKGTLRCRTDHQAEVTLVRVEGDLDHDTSGRLRDEVSGLVAAGSQRVRVDLAGLRSVDGAGVAAFVLVTRTVERARPDASLTLASVPRGIRETIDESGLAELLAVE